MTKSKKELANDYNVSRSTLYRWLKKSGLDFKGKKILTTGEVKKVYAKLGEP